MHLEPKAIWVLSVLARHAGEIVTRQTLHDEVWLGRPVTDEVLSRCVSLLRGTLGDSPKHPAYIQTIPRVGYRLVAPVSFPATLATGTVPAASDEVDARDPLSAHPQRSALKRPWIFAAVLVGLGVLTLLAIGVTRLAPPVPSPAAGASDVAVAPAGDAPLLVDRARHMLKRRDAASVQHARELLEKVVAEEPTLVAARLELAKTYALLPFYSQEPQAEMFRLAEAQVATLRAQGMGTAADSVTGFMAFRRWDWIAAEQAFRSALAAGTADADTYQWYSQMQASLGHSERSLELAERAGELDQLSPVALDRLAVASLWADQDARAREHFEEAKLLGLGPAANPRAYLVLLLREQRHAQAGELLAQVVGASSENRRWVDEFMAVLQGAAGERDVAVRLLATAAVAGSVEPRYLFAAWVYLGEFDRAMDTAWLLMEDPSGFDVEFLFAREVTTFRQYPRFGALASAIGLDRHWDAYGWPEHCSRESGVVRCSR